MVASPPTPKGGDQATRERSRRREAHLRRARGRPQGGDRDFVTNCMQAQRRAIVEDEAGVQAPGPAILATIGCSRGSLVGNLGPTVSNPRVSHNAVTRERSFLGHVYPPSAQPTHPRQSTPNAPAWVSHQTSQIKKQMAEGQLEPERSRSHLYLKWVLCSIKTRVD